jgi:cytoskeletal protein RodZ
VTEPEGFSAEDRAGQLHAALAVEELVAANHESNQTMLSLIDRVREETAARDRKVDSLDKNIRQTRWLLFIGIGAVVILLLVGVINATNLYKSRKTQQQTKAIADQTAQTNRTLLDCLNSTGQCGQINQASQAKILDTVKQYELTVIYCARTNPANVDPKGDKFVACVAKLYPGGPTLNRDGQ